ncbi:phage regulatory protein [Striga asiatica]|uniref:Phage regulatory protein n=1 Tax=Striga asiatica TaxID=4170 RepID=A0A5A7R7H9_STRAF|nr:phage regulatory protein [Striga asiatica]
MKKGEFIKISLHIIKSDRQQRIHNLANKEHNTTGLLPYYKEERMVSYKVKHVHGPAVHRTSNHADIRNCRSLRALFVHLYVCLMNKERDFEWIIRVRVNHLGQTTVKRENQSLTFKKLRSLKVEAYFKLGEAKIPHFHSFTWRVVLYEPRNRAEFLDERLQAIPGIGKKEVHGECPRVLTLFVRTLKSSKASANWSLELVMKGTRTELPFKRKKSWTLVRDGSNFESQAPLK